MVNMKLKKILVKYIHVGKYCCQYCNASVKRRILSRIVSFLLFTFWYGIVCFRYLCCLFFQGLSTDKAKKILRRDGRNVLTPYPKPPGKIRIIFNHFFTLFSFLPWAGTILCIVIFFTRSGISAGEYVSVYIGVDVM